MGLSWDEIKERKRPSQNKVPLALDPMLALEYAQAQQHVEELRQSLEYRPDSVERQQRLADAEERLEEAQTALEPHLVYFTIQALGNEKFEELVDLQEHRPTKEQRDRWRKENPQQAAAGFSLRWNRKTFGPALLAACVVDPELDMDAAKELWTGGMFNQGELDMLFTACLEVNESARVVDLGKGSKKTAPSENNSHSVLSTA